MGIRTKIYKPNTAYNQEDKYKVVSWRNGIQSSVKFVPTKKQALEVERRLKK